MIARVAQAEIVASVHQGIVHARRELRRDVQLPAQLAHVGDARGPHRGRGEPDLPRGAEGEALVGQVGVGQAREERPRARAHHAHHGVGRGHVGEHGARVAEVPADPGGIVGGGRGCRHDEVRVFGKAGHRQIALDAAARVQHGGVDDPTGRDIDVVGAEPLQHGRRVRSFQAELGERGLVEEADRLAHGPVLLGRAGEPVLPAEAVPIDRLHAGRGVPVRALPAHDRAEARAARGQAIVERAAPHAARGLGLAEGPVHGVEHAHHLHRAIAEIPGVDLERRDPANVDVPQVHGRLAAGDPLRQHLAGSRRRGDADGVEAGGHVEVPALRAPRRAGSGRRG